MSEESKQFYGKGVFLSNSDEWTILLLYLLVYIHENLDRIKFLGVGARTKILTRCCE